MNHWWCKRCFVPCQPCIEDLWPLMDPNVDHIGEIKSKTVDLRQTKVQKQTDAEFQAELDRLGHKAYLEYLAELGIYDK